MRGVGRKSVNTSVVDAVAQQTEEAAGLARIEGQHRLASPHTNPAVREHADELRDDEHRRTLRALHARAVRTLRVADRRAANAERTLEVLQAAREMSSPARSVLALHQGRTRFMRAALGASLTLSAGSAIGVATLAVKHGSPAEIGYIAEVGLTGLATTVILYRSHLAQHGGQLEGWKNKVLWALMIGPLLASIVANALGTGGVGVACSVGAAAFSLLSYVMADASAEALETKAKQVTGADEGDLRRIASGTGQVIEGFVESERPMLAVGAPDPRKRVVICTRSHDGTLFLRRPTPKKVPAPSTPAGPVGTKVLLIETLMAGTHAPIVYFLRNGERVKIGTTQSLRARIRRLCLRPDDLMLALHGDKHFENELHGRFDEERVGDSEWFELSPELAAFIAADGVVAAASLPPAVDAPTASTTPPPVANERQEPTVSVANDANASVANPVDSSAEEVAAAPRQRQPRPVANRKRNTRRSMTEWVDLAGPVFHDEFKRLHRPPTGDEFATAIRKARLGTVSASTAKNIRTEILDRTPLPPLDSLTEPS